MHAIRVYHEDEAATVSEKPPVIVNMAEVLAYGEEMIAARSIDERLFAWFSRRLKRHVLRADDCHVGAGEEDVRGLVLRADGADATVSGDDSDLFCGVLLGVEPFADPPQSTSQTALRKTAEHCRRALEKGERLVRFVPARRLNRDVETVLDWLAALPEQDPDLTRKIDRVTFEQAVTMARRWHERLERRADGIWRRVEDDPDGVEEIERLEDGWRWVRLRSPKALDYEGALMRHCAGQGAYDLLKTEVISLRDQSNRPHCTVEVARSNDGTVVRQVKGRANKSVALGLENKVRSFIAALAPVEVHDAPLFGSLLFEGRLIDVNDLPDDLTIDGELDLSGCLALRRMPNRLRVTGRLSLKGCENLEHLGAGTWVGGTLNLRGCTSLLELPDNLAVGENCILTYCTALRRIGPGFAVGGHCQAGVCLALSELPETLEVGGDLILIRCLSLTRLPRRLIVGSGLDLSGCLGLDRRRSDGSPDPSVWPETLRVGRRIYGLDGYAMDALPPTVRREDGILGRLCAGVLDGLSGGVAALRTVLAR